MSDGTIAPTADDLARDPASLLCRLGWKLFGDCRGYSDGTVVVWQDWLRDLTADAMAFARRTIAAEAEVVRLRRREADLLARLAELEPADEPCPLSVMADDGCPHFSEEDDCA